MPFFYTLLTHPLLFWSILHTPSPLILQYSGATLWKVRVFLNQTTHTKIHLRYQIASGKSYCISWQPMFHALHILNIFFLFKVLSLIRSEEHLVVRTVALRFCALNITSSVTIPLPGDLPRCQCSWRMLISILRVTWCSDLRAHHQWRSLSLLLLYSRFSRV